MRQNVLIHFLFLPSCLHFILVLVVMHLINWVKSSKCPPVIKHTCTCCYSGESHIMFVLCFDNVKPQPGLKLPAFLIPSCYVGLHHALLRSSKKIDQKLL